MPLGNYTPIKIFNSNFELGVTRTHSSSPNQGTSHKHQAPPPPPPPRTHSNGKGKAWLLIAICVPHYPKQKKCSRTDSECLRSWRLFNLCTFALFFFFVLSVISKYHFHWIVWKWALQIQMLIISQYICNCSEGSVIADGNKSIVRTSSAIN